MIQKRRAHCRSKSLTGRGGLSMPAERVTQERKSTHCSGRMENTCYRSRDADKLDEETSNCFCFLYGVRNRVLSWDHRMEVRREQKG